MKKNNNKISNDPFSESRIIEIKNEISQEISYDIAKYVKDEMTIKKEELIEEITEHVKQELEDKEIASKESSESQSEVRKKLKKKILSEYVYPDDEDTVKSLLANRKFYASLLQIVRVARTLITYFIVPAILLSDKEFPDKYLAFIGLLILYLGGTFELCDKAIVQSNKKRREKINNVLESIGIKYRVPEITLEDPLAPTVGGDRGSSSNLRKSILQVFPNQLGADKPIIDFTRMQQK